MSGGRRFVFAGYFPKRVVARPEWLAVPRVREIWSVSACMAPAPEGWIDQWKHNDFWLFDSVDLAASVVSPEERDAFTVVAYRIWDTMLDQGLEVPLEGLAAVAGPEPSFESVGFDAVSREHSDFSHSPLSCNHAASTFDTNEECLFRTAEEAISGAKAFSTGNWEPGPYCVVEVMRRR
jgi:hypothetical protein